MPKRCVICGEDCSNRPRTKDRQGRYYCQSCYQQAQQRLQQAQVTQPPQANDTSEITTKPSSAKRELPLRNLLHPYTGLGLLALILIGSFLLGDGFTFLFTAFVVLTIINGYWIGAARIGALLGGLLAGAVIGIPMGKAMEGVFAGLLGSAGAMNRAISIAVCSLLVFLIVTAVLQVVIRRKLKDNSAWKPYDRLAGAGLGLVEGVLVVCLALWALLALEPLAVMSLAQTGGDKPNPVSNWIVSSARKTRTSAIGGVADSTNPLSESRFLTLLADGMEVVNDPQMREAFVNHPAIKQVGEHPSVKQALQMLEQDEPLCKTLESGETGPILKALLTSQTLLKVIDETDVVSDLTPLADGIQQAIRDARQHKSR